jgi:SRSO17 transposase
MTPEQIEELGPAFADYLRQFLFCCDYTQTFDLLGVYCRGLLSDLPRKTCEPIALQAGVAVRTLQEFLRDHLWSFERVRDLLQRHVAAALAALPGDDLGTVGLHDETGTVKDGRHTPGVQRQHCGEVGKLENCLVTVHTGLARGRYKVLFDADLFLPQSWDADRDRCRQARIPDDVRYRPKWQVALGQLDRARANGLTFDWFTFDEGYGDKPGYLQGLGERQVRYVGEVPRSFRCFGRRPRPGLTTWCGTARSSTGSPGGSCAWPGRRWATRSGRSRRRGCGCPGAGGRPTGCCGRGTRGRGRRSTSCPARRRTSRSSASCARASAAGTWSIASG